MEYTIYYCYWDKNIKGAGALTSHDMLKLAVEKYLVHEFEPFTVCKKEPHGKPYIAELPDVHFSISHAGAYWACAIGDAEVGLDLQDYRKRHYEEIAERFFHPSEIEWLKNRNESGFFRIWARKESYVKYTGEGLSRGLDYFSVINSLSDSTGGIFTVDGLPVWQKEIAFKDGYWMAVTAAETAEITLQLLL
ncbi:MAG: 4'-phosphopantetheinyl transferase superfamily protein [Clostridiales bacterium]|nr:4'-phosphopantetheinyl transferase superfamily protein [Clostridiales bacterium]